MILEAYRGTGDRSGAPINEPLLADGVLAERGRAEMNAHAHQVNQVELEIVPRPAPPLGALVSFQDLTANLPVVGRVVGIAYTISREGGLALRLSLEQPLDSSP